MFLVNWTLTCYLKPVSFSWFIYTLQIERTKINKYKNKHRNFDFYFFTHIFKKLMPKQIISKIYLLKLCTTLHLHPWEQVLPDLHSWLLSSTWTALFLSIENKHNVVLFYIIKYQNTWIQNESAKETGNNYAFSIQRSCCTKRANAPVSKFHFSFVAPI